MLKVFISFIPAILISFFYACKALREREIDKLELRLLGVDYLILLAESENEIFNDFIEYHSVGSFKAIDKKIGKLGRKIKDSGLSLQEVFELQKKSLEAKNE